MTMKHEKPLQERINESGLDSTFCPFCENALIRPARYLDNDKTQPYIWECPTCWSIMTEKEIAKEFKVSLKMVIEYTKELERQWQVKEVDNDIMTASGECRVCGKQFNPSTRIPKNICSDSCGAEWMQSVFEGLK